MDETPKNSKEPMYFAHANGRNEYDAIYFDRCVLGEPVVCVFVVEILMMLFCFKDGDITLF
jgi:hypothetical protein